MMFAGTVVVLLTLAIDSPSHAEIDFNRDIRPILADACFHCHGPDQAKRKAKLRLDTKDGAMAVIARHDSGASRLIQKITAEDEAERMPPVTSGRKLTQTQIDLLSRWIDTGAQWQKHWSLIPPGRPVIPDIQLRDLIRNPIDAFILERLNREGLSPSPEAAKGTLIRRVTLDLTGLPPTLAEVDAFLADDSPDAYEKVVDRLLASPRYGERMVLEWLDASRYADTNGFQGDRTRMNWPWRDWVIDALNRNMPFDQFTIEQIAGDLLDGATTAQKVATGFNRNHMLNGEGGRIPEEARVDYVVDRVDTTATVWLGLTLGCARCHDHKYDPFTQKDYYQLYAYFNNVSENGAVEGNGLAPPWIRLPSPDQDKKLGDLKVRRTTADERVKAIQNGLRIASSMERSALAHLAGLSPIAGLVLSVPENLLGSQGWRAAAKESADLRRQFDEMERAVPLVMVMEERKEPRESRVLMRGAYDKYGEKVQPGVPDALMAPSSESPGNRLGLARALVDPANPLTARVAVNRYWQLFFGTGLVKTAEDFGTQGDWPSHPNLLDWLATDFVESGWNVKHIHRLIVTSAAYRQASQTTHALQDRDPENRLIARGPRHRLPSTIVRDQALAMSGLLVERLGGPPVRPYQPPGIWEEMTFGFIKYEQDKGANLYRRSLYTFWRRTVGPTTLFDTSARQVCAVRQPRTNTPLHALILLNDVTYVEAARVLAERALHEVQASAEERINLLFRLSVARMPTDEERNVLIRRVEELRAHYQANPGAARALIRIGERPPCPTLDAADVAAYTGVASVVLNLDEVISKE